jgi:hypothetical protein
MNQQEQQHSLSSLLNKGIGTGKCLLGGVTNAAEVFSELTEAAAIMSRANKYKVAQNAAHDMVMENRAQKEKRAANNITDDETAEALGMLLTPSY